MAIFDETSKRIRLESMYDFLDPPKLPTIVN